jgi:phosphoribosylamine--glycine ligase
LVVGAGAREHALCASLARDPSVTALACAPGNPGIAELAECRSLESAEPAAAAGVAADFRADLVVVGPEAPLVAGVADVVRARGIACFGPSAAAARIEGSKAFAKDVMAAAHVPTAQSRVFTTAETPAALNWLESVPAPYVVKCDGLAGGKGVTVTDELEAARRAVVASLGAADDRVLIEEYLDGPEVSVFGITDGDTVLPLVPAQDFKRVADDDRGPNTGGMGAYAPLHWAPADLADRVCQQILVPTVLELASRGTPFRGLLYAGLALTAHGPRVVEFNARFGDPETQVVLALLETPLAGLLAAAAAGRLAELPAARWSGAAAVNVVLAAAGYPARPRTGDPLTGLARARAVPGVSVYHAGTALQDGRLVSAGGRVLSVTAVAESLLAARARAYEAVACVGLPGGHYRTDIADRASRAEVRVPQLADRGAR